MKVSGSYESVVRGVSQQVPQDRRSGQHAAQTNLINDPVRGAARRHGSVMQDEISVAPYTDPAFQAMLTNTARFRATTFYVGVRDYDLIARTDAGSGPFAYAFDRVAKRFIPVVYAENDPVVAALQSGGMSAATNVGKYLVVAGNSIVPGYTSTDRWGDADNARFAAIWIRGGAYSRTFSVTVTMEDGGKFTATYKTKAASYPELLDTSDLDPASTSYQAQLNNRVNAYNSASTAWIGEAAEDITPQNIATKLAEGLRAQGLSEAAVFSSTVIIDRGGIASVSSDDGGDDSLINAVANDVSAPSLVTTVHRVGKVVKVVPKRSNGDDAFYLEAIAKDAGATGWASVYWKEAAGVETRPTSAFVLATVKDDVLYMASTPEALGALTGYTDVPGYKASEAGDHLTSPIPFFLGKRIDYLGVFQDRLEIGCDAVVMYSRPGDYFNWFRQSILTVADNDPVEQYALGSEFDRITGSATFDRNRVYFGDRYWYSVSGTQPLTPRSNGIVILREEPDANIAPPKSSDNFVFYCKRGGEPGSAHVCTKLYQMQAGLLGDSPEGSDNSSQLDDYLVGEPLEVFPVTSPNTVVVRTAGNRQRLYTYAYMDSEQGGQRLFDAWSEWTWAEQTGHLVAVSRDRDELLMYMLRHNGSSIWIAAERFTLETGLSRRPYADSLRPHAAPGTFITGTERFNTSAIVAFDTTSTRRFGGTVYGRRDELIAEFGAAGLWVGIGYTASVTPTNPYMRDRDGRSIVSGRLTLTSLQVSVADTGGFLCNIKTKVGEFKSRELRLSSRHFQGRLLGSTDNRVGSQPIITDTIQCLVGKEIRECSYTISSIDWLPLTITSLGWVGQYFNNVRRV